MWRAADESRTHSWWSNWDSITCLMLPLEYFDPLYYVSFNKLICSLSEYIFEITTINHPQLAKEVLCAFSTGCSIIYYTPRCLEIPTRATKAFLFPLQATKISMSAWFRTWTPAKQSKKIRLFDQRSNTTSDRGCLQKWLNIITPRQASRQAPIILLWVYQSLLQYSWISIRLKSLAFRRN